MKFSFKLDIELDDEGQKIVVNGVEQKSCESKPEAKAPAMQAKCRCREGIPEESIPCSTDIWGAPGFAVFRVTDGVYSCELDRCKPGYHCEPPAEGDEAGNRPDGYLVCLQCVPD